MKLEYETLISPYPLLLNDVGNVKPLTLREIWSPSITYPAYNIYISMLMTDIKYYCEKIDPSKLVWYNSLPEDNGEHYNMFDLICIDNALQSSYCNILGTFFVENVIWDDYYRVFYTYTNIDEDGNIIPTGIIHKQIWDELCDVILQMNSVNSEKEEKLKFKSKLAQEVWELTHPKEKEEKQSKDVSLPNLISAVAAKSNSLNMINIWDITVYNLYDQFRRQLRNTRYDISAMSVAAWGNKDNKFDDTIWYQSINKN